MWKNSWYCIQYLFWIHISYFKGLFITSPGLWVNLELCSGAFYTTIYIKCQCVVFFSVVIFLKLDSQSCADEIVPARA